MVGQTSGLSEKIMLDAVKFGHEKFIPVIEAIEKLAKKAETPNGKLRKSITLVKRKYLTNLKKV